MPSTRNLPVLVVGAGPTGLTAALELSRLGVAVRIVDRAVAPSTTSRALGVQARTLELLKPRGLTSEMVRLGNRVFETALHARGERIAGIDFRRMQSEFPFILMLAQSETERLLTERLADHGVRVERGVAFETLTLVPIDRDLIEPSLLTPGELAWLNDYHARVTETLAPVLDGEDRTWLIQRCAPIA